MFHEEMEIFGTGQVRSVQTLDLHQARFEPTTYAVQEAGFRYFTYLKQRFRPFVRVRFPEAGGVVIRMLGLTLLTFGPPRLVEGPAMAAIRFPIVGGLLVQRQMRRTGELRFEIHPRRLMVAVEGYYAALIGHRGSALRQRVYEMTQAAIHRRAAEGFLDEWLGRLAPGAE